MSGGSRTRALIVWTVTAGLLILPIAATAQDTAAPAGEPPQVRDFGITLGIIGIAIALGTFGISQLNGDYVQIGDITIDIVENHFHVGDERQLKLLIDVSHGHIRGSDKGSITVDAKIGGVTKRYTKDVTGTALNNDGRTQWRMTFDVQGIDDGQEQIEVNVTVTGDDFRWYWADGAGKKTKQAIKTIGVLFPYAAPQLVPPAPLNFQHSQKVSHAAKISNLSSKTGEIWYAQVNKAGKHNIKTKAGIDFGPGTETELISGQVAHEAPNHPGALVDVPFDWWVHDPIIFLKGKPASWSDVNVWDTTTATDKCFDPGGGGQAEVTPTDEWEPRRPSSGSRRVELVRFSDAEAPSTQAGLALPVRVIDPVTDAAYDIMTGADGTFSWSDLLLGPTVTLITNTGGANPSFEEITYDSLPLSLFEGDPDYPIDIDVTEAAAPTITGYVSTNDNTTMSFELYSRRPGIDDVLLGEFETGPVAVTGRGMLEFVAQGESLVLVPIAPPNRTLVSDVPVVIPVNMIQPNVDFGYVQFSFVPHSVSPTITFQGQFIDRDTTTPVSGLQIEVRSYPDGQQLLASGATDNQGHYEIVVPNGLALASIANIAARGYRVYEPQPIDFGANGSDLLDAGTRELVPQLHGDSNCDDRIDFGDINCFVAALLGGPPTWLASGTACWSENFIPANDANGDGAVDFADINAFVALLVGHK
jgi:hypothetical protein